MILLEAVLLGLVGAAAGTILGYAFVGLTSFTGLDFAALPQPLRRLTGASDEVSPLGS